MAAHAVGDDEQRLDVARVALPGAFFAPARGGDVGNQELVLD